jgi:hypothetical protein
MAAKYMKKGHKNVRAVLGGTQALLKAGFKEFRK